MIQKRSQLIVMDRCGAWTVRVFHIYRGSFNKFATIGDFIKASVKKKNPQHPIKKGKKTKGIIIKTVFRSLKKDGSYICAQENATILLKKRMTPRGRSLKGPIFYGIKRRKFCSSFRKIV